ncbi:MAG: ABC transporter ATP-binding protein [Alloprevotella sp.]|nr:ABC transporter ATP-binding protein [Alloprevotella sp.]
MAQTDPQEEQKYSSFHSLDMLIRRWKEGTLREMVDDWRWIFSYSKRYKGGILYYMVLGFLGSTLGLVSGIVGKYLIDIVTGYKTEYLWLLVSLGVGSTIFNLVFGSLSGRVSLKLNIRISNDIQADIYDKLLDSDWQALNKYSNGDILNRFGSDTGTVIGNAIGWLPNVILSIYNFIATFAVLWHYDHVMPFLALIGFPLTVGFSRMIIKKQRAYSKKVKEMGSEVMSFHVETFYNLDTIKSFGVMPYFSEKLRDWQGKFKYIRLEMNMFGIKTNVILSLIKMVVQFVIFGYCLWLLWTRAITYGTMTLFLQQRAALTRSFGSVTGIIPSMLDSSISAHRIRELVQLPREVHSPEGQSPLPSEVAAHGVSVRMRGVDFAYVEGEQVITNSQLEAHPGEIIALIGPSGEGKTTLIRLILGLVRPQSGEVQVYGRTDGREFTVNADTRRLVSYVPQGNTLLAGTIAENLRVARADATDEEITEALKTACAWDFVEKLPDGINAKVGERGRGFSEGQAQRIAIARAILRDAPILLLDEATSALDVTTERAVLRNIIRQQPNKTCIVTTHRPSVLNLCQRVYRVLQTKVTALSEDESAKMAIDF